MSPDGASLLGVQLRPRLALEVFGKLGLVGKGKIHPPGIGEVAKKALGHESIPVQMLLPNETSAYHRSAVKKILIADIPRGQRAPVKSVTQLK